MPKSRFQFIFSVDTAQSWQCMYVIVIALHGAVNHAGNFNTSSIAAFKITYA